MEDVTGFPEILDGRVKTLHPHVHAGLLADPRDPAHVATLEEREIEPFQLLVANLYPFRQALAAGVRGDELVEQIDVGGPAMIRAAAKNHAGMAVVVDPDAYEQALDAVRSGGFDDEQRRRLAAAAFAHTAAYDTAIATWMNDELAPDPQWWPRYAGLALERAAVLRYGENPHQKAALYVDPVGRRRGGHGPPAEPARRCRSTTTWTPTPRTGWCRTSPTRPSRWSSTPTRAGSRSVRRTPPTRSPTRTARPTRATRCPRSAG